MELSDSLQNTNETTRRVCGTVWLTAEHKRDKKKRLWNCLTNCRTQTRQEFLWNYLTHCRTQTKQQEVSVELSDSLQNTNETTRSVCGIVWLTSEYKRDKNCLWNYLNHCRTQTKQQEVSVEISDPLQNTNETRNVCGTDSLQNTNETIIVCGTIWLTAEHKRNDKNHLCNYMTHWRTQRRQELSVEHLTHCRTQTRQQEVSVELYYSLQNTN